MSLFDVKGNAIGASIPDGSITPEKLSGLDEYCAEVPWTMFLDNTNTQIGSLYADENCAVYVLHLEAGKTYATMAHPYPVPRVVVGNPSYDDNAYPGYYFVYTAELSPSDVVSAFPSANKIAQGILNSTIVTAYRSGLITDSSDYDWTQTHAGKYFTAVQDIWIYRASIKPHNGQMLNNQKFYEVKAGLTADAGSMASNPVIGGVHQYGLGNVYAADSVSLGSSLLSKKATPQSDRVYAAMSRDIPRDRSLHIQFIGDSITYAASNAGLQNAYRKYISMNLNAVQYPICQSGVAVTTCGGSYDWNNGTGDSYDSAMSGYAGLSAMLQVDLSLTEYVKRDMTDLVIVGLGTNDFWAGSPLGSVDDLTDDATFYGAVEKTITLLETTYPNAQIMWILPFKNGTWETANTAGHTLVDYLIALKILCQTHERVWTLDLFDKWYLNYDNENVRSKFFLDTVHISGNAHKCLADDAIQKIREIFSVVGFRRTEQPEYYVGTDSRYPAE